MTLKGYIKFLSIFSLVSAPFFLIACSSTPPAKKAAPLMIYNRINTNYEWAVQYYEAGQYEKALVELRKISAEGPAVEHYELVDFFTGMSFFHLGRSNEAIPKLQAFLARAPKAFEAQEARMTLLRCFELKSDWPRLVSLAAESDNETLYFENRVLLKLLWAEALQGLSEYKGAEKILDEANTLLSNTPPDFNSGVDNYDLRRELRGRYRSAYLTGRARECDRKVPRKKRVTLLGQWAEGYGECLIGASKEYFRYSHELSLRWMEKSQESLIGSWRDWLKEAEAQLKEKHSTLKIARQVDSQVHRSFSRLFQLLQDERKSFQNQQDKDGLLKKLSQDLESLLSQKLVPSSSSN